VPTGSRRSTRVHALQRLVAIGRGCAFKFQRGVPLERRHRRLEEDEHLGRGVERKLLDVGGDGAEARV
jgi:hypothetical protein